MATDSDSLRTLLARGDVIVRVALSSGPCWAWLRGVRAAKGRAARASVSVAGVAVEVAMDAVLEAAPVTR